jgi:histidinol-phosphatase (PHP family)
MVELINHHMHSTGSDGRNSPREMVERAIKKKLDFICFTDHNPRVYGNFWGEGFFSKEYSNEMKEIRKEFKDKIEIGFGIEIDWTEEDRDIFGKQIKEHDFDYVLGSVHIIKIGEEYFGVNFEESILKKKFNKFGERKILREYFTQLKHLAGSGLFDCVAHLDVIKTLNKDNKFFDQDSDFYKNGILEVLDEIKKNGLAIEINTSGEIYSCNEMFPGIPLTIGTDGHWLDRVDMGLKKAYALARKVGYKEILKFKKRKPIKIKI